MTYLREAAGPLGLAVLGSATVPSCGTLTE